MLRRLASPRVSVERKKRLVDRYHFVVPSMLKSIYLIEFYLYLSSRDSLDIRKNNTSSEFWVQFPNPYLLEGQWKCALTEISLTCDFKPRSVLRYSLRVLRTRLVHSDTKKYRDRIKIQKSKGGILPMAVLHTSESDNIR